MNGKYLVLALFAFLLFASSCGTSSKYGNKYDKYSRNRGKQSDREFTVRKRTTPEKKEIKSTPHIREDKYAIYKSNKIDALTQKREAMVESAQSYIGIPYKYAGKNPKEGFDCSGFANFVFTQNGHPMSGPSHELAMMGVYKEKDQLKPGDLVFFGHDQKITHVGIIVSNDSNTKFIHSSSSSGIKVDLLSGNEYWESRYLFGRDLLTAFFKEQNDHKL
ncbi:MAG: hypothetical protein RLZZ546_2928 [Bacteroidota bacterium]|jgi:cell wall-associated NlpC family hydrolase